MKTTPWLLGSLTCFALTAAAASPAEAAPSLHMETDPATFAFRGFAAHVRVVPEESHWSVGAGAYALDFPALLVDANPDNADEGWDVRLSLGLGAFVDYYLRTDTSGWFVGAQLAAQRFHYEREGFAGSAASTSLLAMPRVGYTWFPFDSGLYLMPWFGIGATAPVAGDRQIGGEEYDVFPLIPYGALHLGWQLF
ncbi:MAG: hypothetical protein AB7K71_11730 [Polyangiaceae bacterium]